MIEEDIIFGFIGLVVFMLMLVEYIDLVCGESEVCDYLGFDG